MPGGGFSRVPPGADGEGVQDNGRFELGDFSIDEYRPVRVVVIGAGFSGILAGIRCVAQYSSVLRLTHFALQVPAEDIKRRADYIREERGRRGHMVQ